MIAILVEDIAAVKKQYSYVPSNVFDKIIRIDPTFSETRDSVGKFGKWLLGLYKKQSSEGEEYSKVLIDPVKIDHIKDLLSQYNELIRDRTKRIEKDIMRFRNLDELEEAIENVEENELSAKQAQRQAKKDKPYDMVFEGNIYAVFVPKNQQGDMVLASFGGSSKATWCTAADSDQGKRYYDHYTSKTPKSSTQKDNDKSKLYVIINKSDYNDKYQFHFESKQFNNSDQTKTNCLRILIENDPALWNFFKSEGYGRYIGKNPNPVTGVDYKQVEPYCIREAFILSVEQAKTLLNAKDRIARSNRGTTWWYTSTPDESSPKYVYAISDYGKVAPKVNVKSNLGLRPCLWIEDIDNQGIKRGDSIKIKGIEFKMVTNSHAIPEEIQGYTPFNLDGNSKYLNEYEGSQLETALNNWLINLKTK